MCFVKNGLPAAVLASIELSIEHDFRCVCVYGPHEVLRRNSLTFVDVKHHHTSTSSALFQVGPKHALRVVGFGFD